MYISRVIKAYNKYRNIQNLSELFEEYKKSNYLPIHCAVRRKEDSLRFFHHFIIISIVKKDDVYKITIIDKSAGNIGNILLFSAIGLGTEFCKINKSTLEINVSENESKKESHVIIDKLKKKLSDNVLDFKNNGFFVLGDYTDKQRKDAAKRAHEKVGQKQFYSLESANCEHFVTYCFEGVGKSHQSDFRKTRAAQGDAVIDLASDATKDAIKNGAVVALKQGGEKAIKELPRILTKQGGKFAQQSLSKASTGASAALMGAGVAISVVMDTGTTIYQCHKIKKLYKEKQMSKEDMKIEIKKQVSSAAGGISLGLVVGAGGAAIGSVFFPGAGTAVGFVIGNAIGNIGGKIAGHALAS